MATNIFSVNPIIFKLNKNSTFASELKSSILKQLNHRFVGYTNQILAEYIVVLICLGKDQYQARYKLEAFLGEECKEFVSWLWDFLLESVDSLREHTKTSCLDDDYYGNGSDDTDRVVNYKHRRSIHSHVEGDDSVLSEDEKEYCPLMRDTAHPVSSQRYSLESNISLKEIDDVEGRVRLFKQGCSKKSEPTEATLKYASSGESESSYDTSDSEWSTSSYENEDKIVRDNSPDLPQSIPSHVKEDDIVLSDDEKENCPSMRGTIHPVSSTDKPNDSLRYSLESNVSLKEIDDVEGRVKPFKQECSKKSEPTEATATLKYASSRESESSYDTSDSEWSTSSYENDDKIVRDNSPDLPRQPLRLRKDERPPTTSKLNTGDNHKNGPSPKIKVAEKRSSSRPIETDGVVKNKHRRGNYSHVKGDDSVLSEDEKENCPLLRNITHPVSSSDKPKDSQHYSLEFNISLQDIDDVEGRIKVDKHGCCQNSEPTEATSRGSESSDKTSDSERSMSYEDDDKIVRNNSPDLPRQPLRLREDERPTTSKLDTGDNHKYGTSPKINVAEERSSSRPIDSVSHPNARPCSSVRDRLSRPSDNDRIVRDRSIEPHGGHLVKRTVGIVGEPYEHNRMMHFMPGYRTTGEVPALDIRPFTAISRASFVDESKEREQDLNRMWVPHQANTMNTKREYAAISGEEGKYRHLQYTEPPFKQLQRLPSSKSIRSDDLNNISSGTRHTEPLLVGQTLGSSVSAFIPDVNVQSQRKSCGEATDAGKTDLKPVKTQLLDMKLRLHQIEIEMSKIKEKTPDSNEDISKFLSSSGGLKQSDSDVESRTLFVTNVHFSATKEALSLYFGKCGAIVKVVILTDAVTLKPKEAAYITFAEKESADKALALSGTSFWSRPLKVVRKAEMRANVIPPQSDDDKENFPSLPDTTHPVFSSDKLKDSQCYSLESNVSLKEIDDVEGRIKSFNQGCSKKSEPTEATLKYASSRESESSYDTSDTERSTSSYENDDKIVRDNSPDLPRQPLRLRKDERPSTTSKLNTGDNHKYGSSPKINVAEERSSSRPIDSVPHQDAKPRRSVLDRLSRSPDHDRIVRNKSIESHGGHLVKRTVGNVCKPNEHNKMMHFEPGCRITGEVPACDNRPFTAISRASFVDENKEREHHQNKMWEPHIPSSLKHLQRSPSPKSSCSDDLNNISSGTRHTEPLLAGQTLGSSVSAFIPDVNIQSQRKSYGEATNAGKTDLKPVKTQLLDMKLRLHQIEMELSEIKEKAPDSNEDISKFLSWSGLVKGTTDGILSLDGAFIYFTDGRSSADDDHIVYHDTEKCARLTNKISMIHSGDYKNSKRLVVKLQELPPTSSVQQYAETANELYIEMKDDESSAYIFGQDSTGIHRYHVDVEEPDPVEYPYHILGGGGFAREKLKELLLTTGNLTKEEAFRIAEITLVHTCLHTRCTGGLLTVHYLPFDQEREEYESAYSTDLELYMKHFTHFEELNEKSLLLLRPLEPEMDSRKLQRVFGKRYFRIHTSDDPRLGDFFIDELYHPEGKYKIYVAIFKSVKMREKVYRDSRFDCRFPDDKYEETSLDDFKRVRTFTDGIIGIALCKYETLVKYYSCKLVV